MGKAIDLASSEALDPEQIPGFFDTDEKENLQNKMCYLEFQDPKAVAMVTSHIAFS